MPGIVNWGILPSNPRTQRITVGYATQADLANPDTLAANRVMPITPVEDLMARYVIWDNYRLDLVAQKIDPATGTWPTRKLNFSEGAYICETYGEQTPVGRALPNDQNLPLLNSAAAMSAEGCELLHTAVVSDLIFSPNATVMVNGASADQSAYIDDYGDGSPTVDGKVCTPWNAYNVSSNPTPIQDSFVATKRSIYKASGGARADVLAVTRECLDYFRTAPEIVNRFKFTNGADAVGAFLSEDAAVGFLALYAEVKEVIVFDTLVNIAKQGQDLDIQFLQTGCHARMLYRGIPTEDNIGRPATVMGSPCWANQLFYTGYPNSAAGISSWVYYDGGALGLGGVDYCRAAYTFTPQVRFLKASRLMLDLNGTDTV